MKFQISFETLLLVSLIFIVEARFGDIGYPKRKLWANDFVDRATVETGYVDQLLDNFDPLNNSTWKQKYFYNFEFYKPGGPVFIFLGGEGPIETIWIQKGSMMELCETIDGVAFEPEHRYFGDSIPTKDLTIESLKYLTIEQALSDLAYFIEYIKITHYLEKSKVIVVGGSYAGSLAIWLREKYPQSMDIVWASSAPIQLDVNFPQYFEVIGSVINNINTTCYEEIKRAFDELEKLFWDCHYIVTGKKLEVDRNRPPPPPSPCVRNVNKIMSETFE